MQYTTEIKVRYAETDQMGIVHHSRYFPWFEVARTEFLEEYGIQYGELEKQEMCIRDRPLPEYRISFCVFHNRRGRS